ncbi:MAG: CapA family protein [Clostridiaceae bacterium]|jgi:poly-gamma-glutamate capsule biosynthesis protein CapA/YwtB (metallophosphatase superfamily)|nr:CapA family protein [Clostridiaceae bacterium]
MVRFKVRFIFLLLVILFVWLSGCDTAIEISTADTSSKVITVTPVPSPTLEPTPSPVPVLSATILSAGDVIMHDAVIASGKINDELYDYTDIFEKVKPYVEKADFSVISFEGVVMDSDKNYTGYPLFNAPPAIMTAFANTGFDMVNTGNNHSLDRKLKGLLESRNIIKQEKMQVIGTFQDAAEPRHKIQNLNGIKVGFLSYTYGCNMNENHLTEEERNTHLSLIDRDKIQKDIEALAPRVDMVFVLMHWGVEYRQQPTEEQKELSNDMFQWGADVILGSHPHVVEPSEIHEVNGELKYVVYSMGNYLSNQIGGSNPTARSNDLTEDGMMVCLTIEKDMKTGITSLVSVKHIPTWVYRYSEDKKHKYTVYPIPSIEDSTFEGLDEKLAEKLRNSYNRTIKMVQDYSRETD